MCYENLFETQQEETQAYAFTAFIADAGGALGLFLGLSVLQILH